ncbi:hypothetical protein N0V93_005092 [Gnomoniopsis smithogilvyi]|uniref:Phospholipase/carboxylesterase/thioesterase domain-containing protein n=1 Tax=Gnomoniopsis smithogilvyi TaxID=1191159 RepID=A0A9W9CXQ4_9PEZI|nr:hypothetical protein N0V93_005092 [Gnomoniopsis smithogilvyi]
MSDPVVALGPSASTPHTHTVVFLHGRGDNAANFSASLVHWRDSKGRTLADAFPSFRWVFPQAPLRQCASDPGQIWHQWFDVWDVRDFSAREELQAHGLKEAVPAVLEILNREATTLDGDWKKLILAGISMGAATGVHTLFNLNIPQSGGLGAFLGFSCRCPFAGRSLHDMRDALGLEGVPTHNQVLRDTPVLLEHCIDDPLVQVVLGRNLRDTLMEFGARVEWREYQTGGHWFNSPAGMDDVVAFLARQFSNVPIPGSAQGSSAMDLD